MSVLTHAQLCRFAPIFYCMHATEQSHLNGRRSRHRSATADHKGLSAVTPRRSILRAAVSTTIGSAAAAVRSKPSGTPTIET